MPTALSATSMPRVMNFSINTYSCGTCSDKKDKPVYSVNMLSTRLTVNSTASVNKSITQANSNK